ncbi:hypothetical protein AB0G29_07795 [Streptomyces parvus]|uniref:hypothetical protein n=1 Tax=Streptomyces parvus TaxID=66428 RepID=UPI0033ED3EDD
MTPVDASERYGRARTGVISGPHEPPPVPTTARTDHRSDEAPVGRRTLAGLAPAGP